MGDTMVRVLAKEAGVRGFACITTGLAREGAHRHEASPLSAAVLAQGLTGAALLGGLLKVRQRVSFKVDGDGPVGKMVTEADAYGHVRGYVSATDLPSPINIGRPEIAFAVGDQGTLTVVRDLKLKDLYQGVVPLLTGELDKELTHYLHRSEQIPSFVEIGVKMNSVGELSVAGGLLLQLLPDGDVSVLERLIERNDDMPRLADSLADGRAPEGLMDEVFGAVEYEVLRHQPLDFRCSCSWGRSKRALMLLGREEIESLMDEGEAVVECHFCHERYLYGEEALETILDEVE